MKLLRSIFNIGLILILGILSIQCSITPQQLPPVVSKPIHLIGGKAIHKTVYISNQFNNDQIESIIAQFTLWQTKTNNIASFDFKKLEGNYLQITQDIPNSIIIEVISPDDFFVQELDNKTQKDNNDSNLFVLGFWDVGHHTVPTIGMINDRIHYQKQFDNVVLHEVGHSLFLEHDFNSNAIMYKSMDNSNRTITTVDLAAFCKLHFCRLSEED